MPIRILLADDHDIFGHCLADSLSHVEGFEVVGVAKDGREAFLKIRETEPDVVIMDIGMPRLNGIEATKKIIREYPKLKVVGLSMYSDVSNIINMIKAGAKGYVLKQSKFDEFISCIKNVLEGKLFLCSEANNILLRDYISLEDEKAQNNSVLSDREREILQLIAEGYSNKQISDELSISIKTVETHRKNIQDKLQIKSVAGLTKYAILQGISDVSFGRQ